MKTENTPISSEYASRVLAALQAAMLTLRRCRSRLRKREDQRVWSQCEAIALWTAPDTPTSSFYACDFCIAWWPQDRNAEMQAAPHSTAVRQYNLFIASNSPKAMVAVPEVVTQIARDLLLALPPCPMPLSSEDTTCARCGWAAGMDEDQSFRARKTLLELAIELNEPELRKLWEDDDARMSAAIAAVAKAFGAVVPPYTTEKKS